MNQKLGSDQAGGHEGQSQGENQESDGDPLGSLGELGVPGLGLVLGQEGVRAAGNGAGQTGGLTGLQQNHSDQKQGQQNHDNRQNKHRNTHEANHSFL